MYGLFFVPLASVKVTEAMMQGPPEESISDL